MEDSRKLIEQHVAGCRRQSQSMADDFADTVDGQNKELQNTIEIYIQATRQAAQQIQVQLADAPASHSSKARAWMNFAAAVFLLEGDIKGCFDHVSHDWMLRQVRMDRQVLRQWLKSGYVENRILYPTEAGTPQGGIISPTLANLALYGLERLLSQRLGKSGESDWHVEPDHSWLGIPGMNARSRIRWIADFSDRPVGSRNQNLPIAIGQAQKRRGFPCLRHNRLASERRTGKNSIQIIRLMKTFLVMKFSIFCSRLPHPRWRDCVGKGAADLSKESPAVCRFDDIHHGGISVRPRLRAGVAEPAAFLVPMKVCD